MLYTSRSGRVAHECIIDTRPLKETRRRHRRRRRQAPDRLRLPRADHELAGRRHADDRADRERDQGRARPLLRRDAGHPPRKPRRSRTGAMDRTNNPLKQRAAHGRGSRRRLGPSLHPRAGLLPARRLPRRQVLAAGQPRRQRLWRPQPRLHLPAGRELPGGGRVAPPRGRRETAPPARQCSAPRAQRPSRPAADAALSCGVRRRGRSPAGRASPRARGGRRRPCIP